MIIIHNHHEKQVMCQSQQSSSSSVEDTALVSGNHILDIDEGILTSMDFKKFKCLLNQISKVVALSLAVINLVT